MSTKLHFQNKIQMFEMAIFNMHNSKIKPGLFDIYGNLPQWIGLYLASTYKDTSCFAT